MTLVTFIFFTALVAFLTWWMTRGKGTSDETGYFLAGRSLTAPFIAGSLLLTNLSTEQLVGLNAGAFGDGLSVMAWEVVAGASLVLLALFFLPRYLKSGITTIPQFLEERYGGGVRSLVTITFIVAYMLILLPFVLYSGAKALIEMMDLDVLLGLSKAASIWLMVSIIAVIGGAYAIWGGLRAIAVSDTFNGVGLLIGGLLVTIFSLNYAGTFTGIENPSVFQTLGKIKEHDPEIFNSLGSPTDDASWPTLFTGVLLLNFFYWTTNQQIIQRTFGAKNLAEGQKGVLAAAFFKILAPLILVIPGIVAVYIAANSPEFRAELLDDNGEVDNNNVYGTLVKTVLKSDWLIGFFAAVVVGSILSTFNSVLNSSATLFSLGIYKRNINPDATTEQVVKSGRMVSLIVGLFAVIAAPLIFMGREKGLFGYFQALNGIYFIPILAIVMVGMFNRTVNGKAALITAITGLVLMIIGTFFAGDWVTATFGKGYHYMGAVFAFLVVLQLALGTTMKRDEPYTQQDSKAVDLTPWKLAKPVGFGLIAFVLVLYLALAGS